MDMKKIIMLLTTVLFYTIIVFTIASAEESSKSGERIDVNKLKFIDNYVDSYYTGLIKNKTYLLEGVVVCTKPVVMIKSNILLFSGKFKEKIPLYFLFNTDNDIAKSIEAGIEIGDYISLKAFLNPGDITIFESGGSGDKYFRGSFNIISFDKNILIENNKRKTAQKEQVNRDKAEEKYQTAQMKMRKEEHEYQTKLKRITDLKSGAVKITNIDDAKLALEPSNDTTFTVGVPIDGFDKNQLGKNYEWSGQLKTRIGNTYICQVGNENYFAFNNVVVRYNNMIENGNVTVIGKLAGEYDLTLTNQMSGIKTNKRIAILTDCYIF
jgi:hypothetical protein